jgi:hypothetical protein
MKWDEPCTEDEQMLMELFESNFQRLREESGRSLAPFVLEAARLQVLLYFRKLRSLAEQVDETEVRLVLPEQTSPAGRRYTLEGVIDIVEDGSSTVMYDLKTYLDADAAREHVEPHYHQLSLYAHIWKGLRGCQLDRVAVIATRPTQSLSRALRAGEPTKIEAAMEAWEPILDVRVDPNIVAEVVDRFGRVVDLIEDRKFSPPAVAVLEAPSGLSTKTSFAHDVCRNCDARFGCSSHRQLVRSNAPGRANQALRDANVDFGNDAEKEAWRESYGAISQIIGLQDGGEE